MAMNRLPYAEIPKVAGAYEERALGQRDLGALADRLREAVDSPLDKQPVQACTAPASPPAPEYMQDAGQMLSRACRAAYEGDSFLARKYLRTAGALLDMETSGSPF